MKSAYAAALLSVFSGAVLAAPPGYIGGDLGVDKPTHSNDKCPTKHVTPVIPGVDPERVLGNLLKRDDVVNHAVYAPKTDGNTKNTVYTPRPTDPTDCVKIDQANKPAKTKAVGHGQDVPVSRILDILKRATTTSQKNETVADESDGGSGIAFLDMISKAFGVAGTTMSNALTGGGKNGEKAALSEGVPAKGVPRIPGVL